MASNFEMTYYFLKDAFNTLNYAMLDANGNTIGTFHYLIAVGGDGSTASEFHVDSGNISGDASGTTLDVKDPSGTVHTINGDHAQAQAATLKAFCAETLRALSASKGDDVSSTDSVDISATVGGNIAGIVDVSVTGSYGHTWSTGHSFTTGVSNTVPAGYFGEITGSPHAPLHRRFHHHSGEHHLEAQRGVFRLAEPGRRRAFRQRPARAEPAAEGHPAENRVVTAN
jgi:hypothetical protein